MERDTCYYDGACGMCRRSRAVLGRLDWLHRLDFLDIAQLSRADPALSAIARLGGLEGGPLEPRAIAGAMRGMPMRTRHDRWLLGFATLRRALLQTPAGFLLALSWYVPGISNIGRLVYARVARDRRRDACALAGDPEIARTA